MRNKIGIIKNLGKIDLDALEAEVNKLKAKENELHLEVIKFENAKPGFIKEYDRLKEIEEQQDDFLKEWEGWNALLDFFKED